MRFEGSLAALTALILGCSSSKAPDAAEASPTSSTVSDSALAATPPPDTAPATSGDVAPSAPAATAPSAPERALPATGIYTSPEDALLVYLEGKRTRDAERLWSVMPESARKVLADALGRARTAPAEQLAKSGFSEGALAEMTPRSFFDHMVARAPAPAQTPPPSELTTLPDGDSRARVTYRLAAQACEADVVKDGEGWKVEVARCNP